MSGLRKAKKYDWKDSNMALFGSDLDKKVKKESAETEPAWRGTGSKVGLQIWRIVKFKVTHWPKEDYGKFYIGDSYIILNTFKKPGSDELEYDVHFWIGKNSTQDEYGTAAYKTVELDTLLDDKPVQHREVQNHESDLFKSYFKSVTLMNGGADTGFRHVEPEKYVPRLFHFHGTKKSISVKEISVDRSKLNPSDVFILDQGLRIFVWNGQGCNKDEKFKAIQYCQQLKSDRNGKPQTEVLDELETKEEDEFYQVLENGKGKGGVDDDDDDDENNPPPKGEPKLFRLSDEDGELSFELVKEGRASKSDFKSKDVFIYDTLKEVFAWIGRSTSEGERQNAMVYAHKYLMKSDHPLVPVTCVNESKRKPENFLSALAP